MDERDSEGTRVLGQLKEVGRVEDLSEAIDGHDVQRTSTRPRSPSSSRRWSPTIVRGELSLAGTAVRTEARGPLVALLLMGCAGASRTPPGTPTPSATVEAAPTGSDPSALEEAALNRHVVAGLERMRPCYRRELASDPDLERKMAIRLYVTLAGKVVDMTLMDASKLDEDESKSALNDTIARCLSQEVMRWAFPATAWEGQVQVVHPPAFLAIFSARSIEPGKDDPERERIRQTIRSHNSEYRDCYEAYLDRGAPAAHPTKIKASIRITNEGIVEDVRVLDPTVLEPLFRDCLVGSVRGLRFGKLPGDGYLIVEYPFIFAPGP